MRRFRRIFLAVYGTLGVISQAAIVSVCSTDCKTDSLQAALSTIANCGDTIVIRTSEPQTGNFAITDRGCTAEDPITVTSDRADFLPTPGTRVSPSHLPNMAIIRTNNANPALFGSLNAGNPPSHWRFAGIAFTAMNFGSFTYSLVDLKYYTATEPAQLPDDIVFDRCYFYTPPANGSGSVNVQNGLRLDTRSAVVKDSYFADIAWPGIESHTIVGQTIEGPWTITNNYVMASSIPLFTGGTAPNYGGAIPKDITVRYNYFYRPWKWLADPTQPYYSDFLANGSYHPCNKNLGEFKKVDGALLEFNVHENSWHYNQCEGQLNGITLTPRPAFYESASTPSMGTSTIPAANRLTWTGQWNPANLSDPAVCANLPVIGFECHAVASVDVTTTPKQITVSGAFSTTGFNLDWIWIDDNATKVKAVTIRNSVFRNVFRAFASLGVSHSGPGDQGLLKNVSISNNLVLNDHPYVKGATFWFSYPAEVGFSGDGGANISFVHNTFFNRNTPDKFVQFAGVTRGRSKKQPQVNGLTFENNLLGPQAAYNVFGDGMGAVIPNVLAAYVKNGRLNNNSLPGDSAGLKCSGSNECNGNIVSANLWDDIGSVVAQPAYSWVNAGALVGTISAKAPYARAASDGESLGANLNLLPLVTHLDIAESDKTAELSFTLSTNISSIPCVLEVSSDRNLHSDLGTYSVVPDLDPAFFRQPDSSARTNPKLPSVSRDGSTIAWWIGAPSVVNDDTGVDRDLSLTPDTMYYGRLMCGGATELFTFKTTLSAQNSLNRKKSGTPRRTGVKQ